MHSGNLKKIFRDLKLKSDKSFLPLEIKNLNYTIGSKEITLTIISKSGQLNNPADRDHCLQYMIAIGLIHGDLVAEHYEDDVASDPRVDELREKMTIKEDKRYTEEYLEADKRSIANKIQIFFNDGSSTDAIEVEYPIGHKRRREEGIPVLEKKFENNLGKIFDDEQVSAILSKCLDQDAIESMSVLDFQELFTVEENSF